MNHRPAVIWFRDDLRIDDNRALQAAIAHANAAGQPLHAIWCHTPRQWDVHHIGHHRRWFTLGNVQALSESLARLRIPLTVTDSGDFTGSCQDVLQFLRNHQADTLFFNNEYPLDEQRRDTQITREAAAVGIRVETFDDSVLVAPSAIRNTSGMPYVKFTPFRRAWYLQIQNTAPARATLKSIKQPADEATRSMTLARTAHDLQRWLANTPVAATLQALWTPGEAAAGRRLQHFIEQHIDHYARDRDMPAREATSTLSPYLACGAISPRRLLEVARQANHGDLAEGNTGAVTWISELCWRDFYRHIIAAFPHVSMGHAFRRETDRVPWRHDEKEFSAWCEGRTGYPLVDAAMRQLHTTGWMHNRLRMVTAMFLTKDLLIDWRYGERYFLEHLIDADFASNNGGWQWSASTGTDSVPYFRLFNPLRQAERFDADGSFVRQWLGRETPHQPIVDHAFAKQRVLAAFGNLQPEIA